MLLSSNESISPIAPEFSVSCISITPKRVAEFLLTIVVGLTVCSLIMTIARYQLPDFPLRDFLFLKFSVNKEANIPTLFSSMLLASCGVLLFAIARFHRENQRRYVNYWRFLSFTFFFLALDEMTKIHEEFSKPMHSIGVNGFLHNAWVLPVGGFVLVFGLSYLRFLFHLPRETRRLFVLSFVLYISGVAIVEIFTGYYAFLYGRDNMGYVLVTTIEEVIEMLGMVAFIYTLLFYMRQVGIHWLSLRAKLVKDH